MKNKIIFRTIIPCVFLYGFFRIYSYISTNIFYPIGFDDLFLLIIFSIILEFIWAILEEFQNMTGRFLKTNLVTKIIFIIAMLGIFYLYKITGRI